jgi:hypothetical protein
MAGSVLGWVASFLSLIGITLGTLYQKRYCGGIDCVPAISSSTLARECYLRLALSHSKRAKSIGPAS